MGIREGVKIMGKEELERKIKAIIEFMKSEETVKLIEEAHKEADEFTKELASKRYFDHKKFTEEVRV